MACSNDTWRQQSRNMPWIIMVFPVSCKAYVSDRRGLLMAEKWGENSSSSWSLDFHQTINIGDVYDLPVRQGRITHQQSGSIQLMFPTLNAYLQTGSDCQFSGEPFLLIWLPAFSLLQISSSLAYVMELYTKRMLARDLVELESLSLFWTT